MAYDEDLADRVRAVLSAAGANGVTERRMFGGLSFLLGGHMFCGVVKDTLMVRLGTSAAEEALGRPHVRPMDFTGRPMKGMVFIEPGGLAGAGLRQWVEAAAEHARRLPPKPAADRGQVVLLPGAVLALAAAVIAGAAALPAHVAQAGRH